MLVRPTHRSLRTALTWGTTRRNKMGVIEYPKARRSDFQEKLHGKSVADPYRWMEDPDAPEVKEWVTAQNEIADAYIGEVPFRSKIREKLKEQLDYPKHSTPFKRKDYWYYYYNTGLQNQSVLYQKKDILDKNEEARVMLDPNAISEEGLASLGAMAWTDDGKYLAYTINIKGSDWGTVYVMNCDTHEKLDDKVEWLKYSGLSWTADGKGFFYSRFPVPEIAKNNKDASLGSEAEKAENQEMRYHFIGDSQDKDTLIYKDPTFPDQMVRGGVTVDGKYLIITVSEGCQPENKLWAVDLEKADLRNFDRALIQKPIDEFAWMYSFIGNKGSVFYCLTSENASNKKVISFDLANSAEKKLVIPEDTCVLEDVSFAHDNLAVLAYLRDVRDVLYVIDLDKPAEKTLLPTDIGTVYTSISERHPEVFFCVTSFSYPKKIYRFTLTKGKAPEPVLWHEDKIANFDSSKFVVEQHFITSKDGTKVPMFLVHKKDLKKDGNNLTMMYGYGGFRINLGASFCATRLLFLNNMDGIYAQVNIRGGEEYGEEWWKGGALKNKMNCFDDFNAAGQWLQDQGYTSPSKLVMLGGSNGGTLVAACANLRPDLYSAGVALVGVMDMTRFHKFHIGAAWRSDFGDPDVEEDYDYIMKYSPLHNIHWGKTYPAILCQTGDHDDRVAPLHTFKYMAELQHQCGNQKRPLLAKIEVNAGHGGGKPISKVIEELVDRFSFIARTCDAKWVE